MSRLSRTSIGLLTLLAPLSSYAACDCPYDRKLCICMGTSLNLQQIGERVMIFLSGSIVAIAVTMFVVGSFMLIVSGAREEYKERGKKLITGSLISVGVVLGAYGILRTIAYYLL